MSEPIRLAILGTRGVPARYGGFEKFAEELGSRLAARGLSVTVYCERHRDDPPRGSYRGLSLHRIRALPLGPLSTIWYDLRCLLHSIRRYDLVYMLGYGAAWALWLPRMFGTPVLTNMDGLEWKREKWGRWGRLYLRIMEWTALRTSTAIVLDSEAVRRDLESRHGPLPRCWTVGYGADVVEEPPPTEPLARWGLSPGEYYLVVCRLEPENHVEEIVEGFRTSGSRRQLVVVGNHQDTACGLRLSRQPRRGVLFLGPIYDPAVLTSLRFHCAAYLHGHSVGGTNPSLLEALGCGNRVLCHDNPFNREVVAEKGSYFRTAEDLAALLRRFEDGGAADADPGRMREIVRERFAPERIAQEYRTIIQRVCSRSGVRLAGSEAPGALKEEPAHREQAVVPAGADPSTTLLRGR